VHVLNVLPRSCLLVKCDAGTAPWNDAASVWGVRIPHGLGAGAAPAEEAADSVNPAAKAIMRKMRPG